LPAIHPRTTWSPAIQSKWNDLMKISIISIIIYWKILVHMQDPTRQKPHVCKLVPTFTSIWKPNWVLIADLKSDFNSRFKIFSIKCHIPTTKQIEANKRCEIDLDTLQVRIWQPKSKVYVSKQSITIRFIRKDIFLI